MNSFAEVVCALQIGDIPDADIKPPDNVLFVCKLNPVTEVRVLTIQSAAYCIAYTHSMAVVLTAVGYLKVILFISLFNVKCRMRICILSFHVSEL